MNRLAHLFSQISPKQYLQIVILSIATLTFANLLFSAMIFELGHDYKSIISGPDDRFADLVKVSLSFKTFTPHLEDCRRFQSWPALYKYYYMSNPYGGKAELAQGRLTHFHLPPFSELIFIACAIFVAHTQNVSFLLVIFVLLYLMVVQWTISIGLSKEQRTITVLLAVWFISLLSYPSLMAFTRGNFNSGFTSLLIAAFMLSLFGRGRANIAALASLAVAVNFRPNAIIFVFAIPVVLGLRSSIKPVLRFAALALGILLASYFTVHALYPDYTFSTFHQGLETYNRLYLTEGGGDTFNSSLFSFIKTVNKISKINNLYHGFRPLFLAGMLVLLAVAVYWGLKRASRWIIAGPLSFVILYGMLVVYGDYHQHLFEVFLVLLAILVAAVCWSLWLTPNRILIMPFYLTALYCLITPIFADYDLLVFIAPILLVLLNFQKWAGNYHLISAIVLGSILMLSPKNYYFVSGTSIQLLLNPLILFILTLYLVKESVCGSKSKLLEGAAGVHAPAIRGMNWKFGHASK